MSPGIPGDPQSVRVVDSHTHLDSLDDPDAVLARAAEAGVAGVVSVATSIESMQRTVQIAERHQGMVRVAFGIHPQAASSFDDQQWGEVEELGEHAFVCAIGETGLDQFRDYGPLERQRELFERHAGLARRRGLPLVIHTRAADDDTMQALRSVAGDTTIVMHCFSMTEHLSELLDIGCYISFAGNVTFRNAYPLHHAARHVPADRLLVETDAPYLAPVPFRGKANEPAYVVHTLAHVAQLRDEPVEELAERVTDNAAKVFGFSWPS